MLLQEHQRGFTSPVAVTTSCVHSDMLPWFFPAESKWHWGSTASLLEGKQQAGLFWKNRCTCTCSRKSHYYKPTAETDLKENRSHSMISYSLYSTKRVFNKAERQKRTATVVGNRLLHSTASLAAKSTAGYWRYKRAALHLKEFDIYIDGIARCYHNRPLTEARESFPAERLLHN